MLKMFRAFFTPPTFEGNEEKTREGVLLFRVLQVGWIVPLVTVLVSILVPENGPLFLPIGAAMAILTALMTFAARRGHIRPISILFLIIILLIVGYTDFIGGGLVRPATVLFAVVIVAAGLLLGSWGAGIMAMLLIIEHGAVVWAAARGLIHAVSPMPTLATNVVVTAVAYAAIAMVFGFASNSLNSILSRLRAREQELAKSNRELQDLTQALEARVAERTLDIERRAAQLKIAAEVGSAAASLRDLKSLLSQVVRLIALRFGFYHAGIFLIDERGEYAVLQAASSEGGRQMLARGHRLQIGYVGIVGNVAQSGQARVALDVGQDAVFFDNPDLPETRSEMALPIAASGRILGVLDVQSRQEAAFTQNDVATLQIVADQLAVAIENARLLGETQSALEATRRAYGEVAAQAWRQRLQTEPGLGFSSDERGNAVKVSTDTWSPAAQRAVQEGIPIVDEDGSALSVPILIRGQAIGALRLVKPNKARWTEEETQVAQTLSEQLSGALDSARLYDEAQRRAYKERAIGEIAGKISTSANVDSILRTAVLELGKIIPSSDVTIQLRPTAKKTSE